MYQYFIPFFFFFYYLFIFGCSGSSLLRGLFSSFGERGLLSSCGAWASHCSGFSCCRAWALGRTAFCRCGTRALVARGMWNLSGPGIQSCISRWIPIHCATKQVPSFFLTDEKIFHQINISDFVSVQHLMNVWVVFTLKLLWIVLLWIFTGTSLYKEIHSGHTFRTGVAGSFENYV